MAPAARARSTRSRWLKAVRMTTGASRAPAIFSATYPYPSHVARTLRHRSVAAPSVVGTLDRARAPVDQRQSRWTQNPFSVGSNPTGGTTNMGTVVEIPPAGDRG